MNMIGSASAALIFTVAGAHAEALRFTTAGPATHPGTAAMQEMADTLAENTGGDLTMKVFPSNQLGDEIETIKQVSRGRIDIGGFSITAAASAVPEIAVIISPYFWDSAEQATCAIDNGLGELFGPYFERRGLKIVQWQSLGWQIFFAKDPIIDPSDVVGYKVRVSPAKNHAIFWRASGANGIPLPFAETATALQTGIVDGGELPTVSYIASGMGEIAPHLIKTNHIYQPLLNLMSTRTWNKLSADQQRAFEDALPDPATVNRAISDLDAMLEKRHVDSGGAVHELMPEQRAKWAALFTDEMQQELLDEIGGDAHAIFEQAVAAREACTR